MIKLNLHDSVYFAGVLNKVSKVNGDNTYRLTEVISKREHGCYYIEDILRSQFPVDTGRNLTITFIKRSIEYIKNKDYDMAVSYLEFLLERT